MQEAAHPPARVPSRVADAPCLRCLHGGGLEQVRQWRQKRVLMRPEAAFPYVFAAEGAQHPPNKPPRQTSRPAILNEKARLNIAVGGQSLCLPDFFK